MGRKLSKAMFDENDQASLRTVAELAALGLRAIELRKEQAQLDSLRRQVLSSIGSGADSGLMECSVCGRCYEDAEKECQFDGSVPARTLPVPRTINGRYRPDRRIGAGGMVSAAIFSSSGYVS